MRSNAAVKCGPGVDVRPMTSRRPSYGRLRAVLATVMGGALTSLVCGCSSGPGTSPDAGAATHDSSTLDEAARDGALDARALDAWTVPDGCNPLAVTNDCMLPYPSDFLTVADPSTPTGLRVALPVNALTVPDAAIPVDMTPFNRGDGAPTSAAILVHFGVDIGESFLAGEAQTASSLLEDSPIALLNESTGERMPFLSEMDANSPDDTTRHALIIRPVAPLAFGTRYVVVLSNALRDANGKPLPSSPGFVALRDGTPTHVPALEGARGHFEQLFSFLAAHGYPRDSLQLAWDYTTSSSASVIGPISVMRQEVFRAATSDAATADASVDAGAGSDADAALGGGGAGSITYTISSVTPAEYMTGATVIEGAFTPPNYLQADNTILYSSAMVPMLQTGIPAPSYPFTMVVPDLATTQTLSLLVVGHGAGSDGRTYLTAAPYANALQPLTEQLGTVLVATDWIGLSSGDESLVASAILSNINNVGVLTDRMLQGLVNNLSLIELSVGALQSDVGARLSTVPQLIDPTRVYYLGGSLGGVEGSSLISVSRHITRGVMVVPGASWSTIGRRSYALQALFGAVELVYPDPLFAQEFFTLMQARYDPSDPINLATLFQTNPLPESPASRAVLLEEGIDDCIVPNLSTEMLARAYGLALVTPSVEPIFGVATAASPTTQSGLSQFKITSDVVTYVPPTTDVPPSTDNHVHEDLATEPQALAETVEFLHTGTVVQVCNGGPCILP